MRLDEVDREVKPRANCGLREPAIALMVCAAGSLCANPIALEEVAFAAMICGIFLGPMLLPLACLAWYGQPGLRSSDRVRRPWMKPKVMP